MKIHNAIAVSVSLIALAGCSTVSPPQENIESAALNGLISDKHNQVIAQNMISTLSKLDSKYPTTTTIQMVKARNDLGKNLFNALEDEGYGIQFVTGDVGQNYLSYKHLRLHDETGYSDKYIVSVGNVVIEREYSMLSGSLVPTSPMSVSGSSVDGDELDDSMFSALADISISSVVEAGSSTVTATGLSNTDPNALFSQGSKGLNVHDLRGSNYGTLFTNYENVERETLVFGNDSFRLSRENKQLVAKMVSNMNPETDLISIIGCSHGNTALNNGNQILAEGRTQRVREAFLFAGVAPDLIKDEACWSSDYWDEVAPRRGVIVSHKRILM